MRAVKAVAEAVFPSIYERPVSGQLGLGLDLAAAVGRRFTFYMDDADEQGRPDDIMFNGVVIRDEKYGYLAQSDDDGVYSRSQISEP